MGAGVKQKKIYRFCLVLILALTALIYVRSLNYGTVNWDDALSRKMEQGISGYDRQGLARIMLPRFQGTYQPVRELISFLLAGLSGPDTWWPYHLVSLVLYLGTILFFYFTVRLLLGRLRLPALPAAGEWGALLATAFFAFHPGHVEVTAWVLGQKDTLVGFFYLGSLYFYVRSAITTRGELIFSLLLFLLALGSKPTAVSLALVPPLYDRLFRPGLFKPGYLAKLIGVYSLYFLPAAAGVLYFVFTSASIGLPGGLEAPLAQMGKIAGALSFSAAKLALPVNLCLRYPAFGFGGFTDIQLFFHPALALLILFWTIKSYLDKKPYAFFLCWALAAMLPNLNLIPIRIERADRYYYLASMGFSGLAGYAAIYLYRAAGRSRAVVIGSILVVLVSLAAISSRQVGFWSNGPAAWNRTLSLYPDLPLARVSLGHSYLMLGQNERALEIYRPMVQGGRTNVEALKGTAIIMMQKGQEQEARALLKRGLRLAPEDYELAELLAHLLMRRNELDQARELVAGWAAAEPHNRKARLILAELSLRLGRHADAARILYGLLETQPNDAGSMNLLALAHLGRRDTAEAERLLKRAVELEPGYKDAWMNLARVYASTGRRTQAAGVYSRFNNAELDLSGLEFMGALHHGQDSLEQALECFLEMARREPRLARAYNNAGVVFEAMGRYAAADSLYIEAVELDSAYVDAFFNRGNLLRRTGNLAAAVRQYQRADSLAAGRDRSVIQALGETFEELGDKAAANRCFGRLEALEPGRR